MQPWKSARALLCTFAAFAAFAACGVQAQAQDYPNRPVQIIVPFPPGQTTDVVARIVAERLSAQLKQPFVIVNRAGAGGQIGAQQVMAAAPDGYTLLGAGSGPITVLPSLRKVPYDPLAFTPVSTTASVAFALVSRPDFPAKNVGELIQLVKNSPDKYTYASAGVGTTAHLATEYFNASANLKARHIVFNGSSASLAALAGSQVDYAFDAMPAIVGLVNGGKLKGYGVSQTKRVAAMPDLATVSESAAGGLPNFELISWLGYLGPPGLPAPIAEKLASEVARAMKTPEVMEAYKSLGLEPYALGPSDMAGLIRRDLEKYGGIAKRSNIKVD